MKNIRVVVLIILSVTMLAGFRFLRSQRFVCPIKYDNKILVRCDDRGDGFFGTGRSGGRLHNGVDLYAKVGVPVVASRAGRVIKAAQNYGMGKFVVIRHRGGYTTVYGHLSKIYVKRYQRVRQGQAIGAVGKTGNARYREMLPHLHFEVKKNGIPQDPLKYIRDKSNEQPVDVSVVGTGP